MPPLKRVLVLRGESRTVTAPALVRLADVLRSELGAAAVPRGCDDGSCGACRVLVDDQVVNACAVPWTSFAHGARVELYSDIEEDPAAVRAVEAFDDERSTRCRLCVPGLAVTAVSLARGRARARADATEPSDDATGESVIESTLETMTCSCTGRGSLRRALRT